MLMTSSLGKIRLIKCMGLKGTAIGVFKVPGFELHKWNSNVLELEADNKLKEDSQKCAKE